MFALDLFNTDHERRIAEGAVDQLEQRRIDDLAMRMDDLVARAKDPAYKKNPAALAALMKEFQKCKAERDSYYKVKEGTVTPTKTGIRHHAEPGNYGGYQPEPELKGLNKTLTKNLEKGMGVEFKKGGVGNRVQPDMDEAGIPGNVPTEKIPGKEELLKGRGRSYYEADQKKNSDQFEGYQDFNKVEPYAVCLAGKPVKKFDYYEQARRFHDNWKQKLYREGDKAKADTITLMPLNLDETNSPAQQAAIAVAMKRAGKKPKSVDEGAMSNVHAAMADVYHRLAPKIERHRDSFLAGQLYDELENIAELHGIEPEFKRMMTGARNRAHMDYDTNPGGFHNWFWFLPFEDKELSEEQDTSGVERAILNRVMVAHTDLLMKFGPEKVMQAAEEVAYNVGDVDEIGTSDVSAYVNQVRQILGA